MKATIFTLAAILGLTSCATVERHHHTDRSFRPTQQTLSPDLARELGKNVQNDESVGKGIAFVVVVDKYNKISLLRASNGNPREMESAVTQPQTYPSVKDSPYRLSSNSPIKILTREAETKLREMGLKDTRYIFALDTQPMQLMSAEGCVCTTEFPQEIRVRDGGAKCIPLFKCYGEDDDYYMQSIW